MEPIAVIGIGCRFPAARGAGSLWKLLCSGRDVLQPVPAGRYLDLNEPEFGQSDLGRQLAGLRGGFLEGIDLFDPAAFGISPREARVIDPQQRLLLETTWEALEDAGQDMRALIGAPVGVYFGIWNSDYQTRLFWKFPQIDISMAIGGGCAGASGRVSYAFGFEGPCATVDTACSSSLVAIHLACQALRAGECELAIAGGANAILDASITVAMLSAGTLSPDGRCKFGDASADGFVRSEGAGAVVLKTLRKALADNDPIHAVIRGSAVTHNGQTGDSLVAPGEEGQFRLLKQALAVSGLAASDLAYIEAHGTGTTVGDRMELRALGRILREGGVPFSSPCPIGSIKTNIGHAESAAGVAGLIKAILCLKHREVPPGLNFLTPNPAVPWAQLPLKIVTERTQLKSGNGPLFAGVNSFGITGTFAHVILEEAPEINAKTDHAKRSINGSMAAAENIAAASASILLPVSARSREALAQLAGAFAEQIRTSPDRLPSIAFSAGVRRTHHEFRLAVVGRDAAVLAGDLERFARGEPAQSVCTAPEQSLDKPKIGWVFSGQGPQWPGMGRQLFETEPVFRSTIETLEKLIQARAGWSLLRELFAPQATSRLDVTAVAQPAIFSIQVALAELLKSWELAPAMIVGHSVGEAAAACMAGIFSLDDAVKIICDRARIAEHASGLGKMAAVELTVNEANALITKLGGTLSLAAVNGPRSVTVSGAVEPLRKFCEQVEKLGRFSRLLDVNYPFHSSLLDPLLPEMAIVGGHVSPQASHTPLYSTVYGRLARTGDFTPEYWPRNLRQTVQFAPAIEQMAADGCNVFVEISPHPVLSFSIKQVLASGSKPGVVVETLRRNGDEPTDMRRAVGQLYARGCDADWRALVPPEGRPISLPMYPWQRESYWIEEQARPTVAGRVSGTARTTAGPYDPLLQRPFHKMGGTGGYYWESDIGVEQFPWLADHRVQGRAVFPATAYLMPALKAAAQLSPGAVLAEVEFAEALFVPAAGKLSMQFSFERNDDGTHQLAIYAGDVARPELARKHVSGRVRASDNSSTNVPTCPPVPANLAPAAFAENGAPPTERDAVYASMHRRRLDYGPAFRGIQTIRHGRGEALARLTLPPAIQADASKYGIHPATLDACLQTLIVLTPEWSKSADLWLPRRIAEVSLRKLPAPGDALWALASLVPIEDPTPGDIVGNVFLIDESGEVLVAVRGLQMHKVGHESVVSQWLHEVRWQPQALPPLREVATPNDFMPPLAEFRSRLAAVDSTAQEQEAMKQVLAELNRIGGLSVQHAMCEMGLGFAPGLRFTLDEAAAEIGIVPEHRRLLKQLLRILCEEGVLLHEGDAWRVERTPASEDFAAQLQSLHSVDPGFAPLLRIFRRVSLNLAAVLSGRAKAVELLFAGDGAGDLELFYSSYAGSRTVLRQLAAAVKAVVQRLPEGRKLRILEIGAGTGALTSYVLPLLPPDRTEYVFTDLTSYFLTRAREKFAAYPFMTQEILDLEEDPVPQGFAAGRFDLVMAASCVHATRNIRQSLQHVHQLLAPGGWMLLQEETAANRLSDLIFGLTDGWWRFDDDVRSEHPLLSPSLWVKTLDEQGFADAAVIGGDAQQPSSAAVILARKPTLSPVVSAASDRGRWLLLSDAKGVAQKLGERLEKMGRSCLIIDCAACDVSAAVAAWLIADDVPGRTLVDLRPIDSILNESDDSAVLAAIEQHSVSGLLDVAHQLIENQNAHSPRLALITCGSQATGTEQGAVSLSQAPLWTLVRVASLENPRVPMLRIDLEPGRVDSQIEALASELLGNDGEPEVAFRHASRLVPRLHRVDAPTSEYLQLPTDHPFAINVVRRGAIDGAEAHPETLQKPGRHEVQLRVIAAGLNFRDLLNILGAVPAVPPGLECAGIVTAVGEEVRNFSVGDEVMVAGFGCWRTYLNISATMVVPKPRWLSFEQAAAMPIAYLTAHYTLRHVAGITPGQRVLIHSAAGGVGVAAVYMALAAGAKVFGTAGSEAKRSYLRSIGVHHVFDSRSLDFAEQIRAINDGQVDVVLNCFTGDFISKSVDLLVNGGHFVEIGMRDIWTKAEMAQRRPDVKYHASELAFAIATAQRELAPMLQHLSHEFAERKLPPLPIRAFSMSHLVPALRYMQQARHTGKIVLTAPPGPLGQPGSCAKDMASGSWLVTGGLGGLGLAVAEWLVGRGVRQLILIGRSAPDQDGRAVIDRLALQGVRILVEQCDVADERAVGAMLERCTGQLSPLRGVLHLAGVLDDAPLQHLDWPRFAPVYSPKVLGAWNLHRLTRDMNLNCFVLFSSWAALLGSVGQANHSSANAFLDALAHHRRAQGLAAQSINWGAWRGIGAAARTDLLASLARRGWESFSPEEGIEALAQVMSSDLVQVGISPFDANAWQASNQSDSVTRFISGLTNEPGETTEQADGIAHAPLRVALSEAAAGPPRRQVMEGCIQRHLARVLRSSSAKFDVRKSFKSLGLDSLTSLELRNYLELDAEIKLPASLVYNHATIATLATGLAAKMGTALDENPTARAAETGREKEDDKEIADLLNALQQMPSGEAQRLLELESSRGGDR